MYSFFMREEKPKKVIDHIIILVAVLEPMLVLPQALHIFRSRYAEGVSILTWSGLSLLTAIWAWYAYEHNERMVLLYQGLFLMFNSFVMLGALLYG